jgi:hypothetical protein
VGATLIRLLMSLPERECLWHKRKPTAYTVMRLMRLTLIYDLTAGKLVELVKRIGLPSIGKNIINVLEINITPALKQGRKKACMIKNDTSAKNLVSWRYLNNG